MPIRREVGDRSGEATTLSNIGLVYDGSGDRRRALEYYELALRITRTVEGGARAAQRRQLRVVGDLRGYGDRSNEVSDSACRTALLIASNRALRTAGHGGQHGWQPLYDPTEEKPTTVAADVAAFLTVHIRG